MTSFVSDFHIFYDANVTLGREANVILPSVYLEAQSYSHLGQTYIHHLNLNLTIGISYMPAPPRGILSLPLATYSGRKLHPVYFGSFFSWKGGVVPGIKDKHPLYPPARILWVIYTNDATTREPFELLYIWRQSFCQIPQLSSNKICKSLCLTRACKKRSVTVTAQGHIASTRLKGEWGYIW